MESDCKVAESGLDFIEEPAGIRKGSQHSTAQHSWGVSIERIKHFMSVTPVDSDSSINL